MADEKNKKKRKSGGCAPRAEGRVIDMARPKKDKKSGAKGTEGNAAAWDAAAQAAGEQGKLPIDVADRRAVEVEIAVEMSTADVAAAAHEAGAAQERIDGRNREIATWQMEIDARKRDQKEQREANEADDATRGRLLREVNTGKRVALVPCIEVSRYPTHVETYRADPSKPEGLGDKVSERTMTAEERKAATFAPPSPDAPRVQVPDVGVAVAGDGIVIVEPPEEPVSPVNVSTKADT